MPTSPVSKDQTIASDYIMWWHPSKHSGKCPPCSHILHACQSGYCSQTHLNPTHCQQSACEHTCPLQVQEHQHMHSVPQQKTQALAAHLLVAFVKIAPVCPTLSTCPHFTCLNIIAFHTNAPYWTLRNHPPFSHILHACQQGYTPSCCIHQNNSSAFCPSCPQFNVFKCYSSPKDISSWNLVECSPSILHAPTFCIHVDQTPPHKSIQFTTTLKDLLVSTPTFFNCNPHWHMH